MPRKRSNRLPGQGPTESWWVNRKDAAGNNVFEGGFLCLDNIGPIDRSAMLPVAARLEQSDRIASMAMYSLNLLEPHEGTHPNHVSGSVKGHGLG